MAKKKALVYTLMILVALLAVCIIVWKRAGTTEIRDYTQILHSGELNVVTDYSSVGYYVSGDTIAGFNYDLIQLLKSYTSLRINVFLESSLDKSIYGLKEGKYDIIAQNIPTTSVLKDSLAFTEVIAQNRQVLVQRRKQYNDQVEPIRSHLNLAKKTLYVPLNSPVKLRIHNLSHEIGDTIYIKEDPVYGAEQLIMMVASKDIDYAVCDEQVAASLSRNLPEIDYSTLIGFTHLEAWVVRNDAPVLLDSLNVWMKKIKESEAYSNIYMKYYK